MNDSRGIEESFLRTGFGGAWRAGRSGGEEKERWVEGERKKRKRKRNENTS